MLMISRRYRFLLAFLSLACLQTFGAPSHAATPYAEPEESFNTAFNASDNELAESRGGFAGPNGLSIGFGLSTSTSVNGMIVSNFALSSKNLGSVLPQNLQQMVQTGSANTFISSTPAALSNNVVTLIQNNVNNVTIQNTSVLSVNVSNLASMRNNAALLSSVTSMIRAMH